MAGFFIISFMEVSGMNQSTPGIPDDINNFSNTICSSPRFDELYDKMDRSFLLETNGTLRMPPEVFGWEIPMDAFDGELLQFPNVQPETITRPRHRNSRPKHRTEPIVLMPFQSCLSVELAVKALRKVFNNTK
jgi:hypothetical protein